MFRVDARNNVFMTRGDDVNITVNIQNYTMKNGDTLTLTARRSYNDDTAAFSVTANGTNVLNIDHSKTNGLDVGEYVYDIELMKAEEGTRHTIIGTNGVSKTIWTILGDVTR